MAAAQVDATPIRVVAVIGAGSAGRRFALRCAAAGFEVVLEDVMPENLRRAEGDYLEMVPVAASAGTLRLALTVEDAVERADLAVDFVPDELESKLEIFSLLDRMAPPRTIFCTPSDALSITDLASCVYRPERCFAVRGEMLGERVRVIYPHGCSGEARARVIEFFQLLGLVVEAEADQDVPVLMKNLIGMR